MWHGAQGCTVDNVEYTAKVVVEVVVSPGIFMLSLLTLNVVVIVVKGAMLTKILN